MRLSILTTITNPTEREDKYAEALACYCDLADEVVVVNGGKEKPTKELIEAQPKIKWVDLFWPNEWNWIELPRHLNAGLKECTGNWVLKLDIDQFIHENDFQATRNVLEEADPKFLVGTFQKMSFTYAGKYYQKGPTPIAFRRFPGIEIGQNLDKETDLCFPVQKVGVQEVTTNLGESEPYEMPVGRDLPVFKTRISFWNYDYFFKTQEFTRKEFWRFSKAYQRFFGSWTFGGSEEDSFQKFMNLQKGRHKNTPYTAKLEDHSKYIRKAVSELTPEQFGHSAWGL